MVVDEAATIDVESLRYVTEPRTEVFDAARVLRRARARAIVESWVGPRTEIWWDRRRAEGVRRAMEWIFEQAALRRAARGVNFPEMRS